MRPTLFAIAFICCLTSNYTFAQETFHDDTPIWFAAALPAEQNPPATRVHPQAPVFSAQTWLQAPQIGSELALMPNPTVDFVVVNFGATKAQTARVYVVDEQGKTLLEQETTTQGFQPIISVKDYPSGTYFVHLHCADGQYTILPFVKIGE